MEGVFHIDKSLQVRLDEYEEILPPLLASIKREWSNYLNLHLDPNGWQAVWKVPRSLCEALHIPFPSIALVIVLDVHCDNLEAVVKVLGVEDEDIHIPERHTVPLVQLWVTKMQDKSIAFIDIVATAHMVDALRFFYSHLYMPWDNDEDDNMEWKEKHLEARLRLYYDMRNGIVPSSSAERLRSLISEARRLYTKREALEELVDYIDKEEDVFEDKNSERLMEIHIRMREIKGEMEIYEDPLLRKVLMKKQNEPVRMGEKQFWLVFDQGNVQEYTNFLESVKMMFGITEEMRFAPTLGATLDKAPPNSTFVLKEAVHRIHSAGSLELGGQLLGVSGSTVVTSEVDDVMLDFSGERVDIKNLTIDAKQARCAILLRKGRAVLQDVRIIGDGRSSTAQGIIVLPGATLELHDCEIAGFSNAITGNSNSTIVLRDCRILNVDYGLKVFDDCLVKAERTRIEGCKRYGVVLETQKDMKKNVGSIDLLKIVPHFKMEDMVAKNNGSDAVIRQKSKIRPLEDLFTDPSLDLTVCEDAEMNGNDDHHNATVIENEIIESVGV